MDKLPYAGTSSIAGKLLTDNGEDFDLESLENGLLITIVGGKGR